MLLLRQVVQRIDCATLVPDLEVEVRPCCVARRPDVADGLPLRDTFLELDSRTAEMGVQRDEPIIVVDHDDGTVPRHPTREDDLTRGHREDALLPGAVDVDTLVELLRAADRVRACTEPARDRAPSATSERPDDGHVPGIRRRSVVLSRWYVTHVRGPRDEQLLTGVYRVALETVGRDDIVNLDAVGLRYPPERFASGDGVRDAAGRVGP